MPRIMALSAALIASVFSVTLVDAQPVLLAEPVQTGDCLAVRLDLVVKGSLKVARDTSLVSLPLSAIAEQSFTERLLVGGLSGQPARAARRYDIAKATITVDGAVATRKLRDERRLLIFQRSAGLPLHYSPAGALLREELELVGEHLDTLAIPAMLPGRELKPGETWDISPFAVQALCDLEAMESHAMTGRRVGFTHGPARLNEEMLKLQQFTFVCAPSMAQHGALVALDVDMSAEVASYKARRDFIRAELTHDYHIGDPGGAFYLYVRAPKGRLGTEFVAEAIERNLLIIPGKVFSHHDTHFRISYAASMTTLERGVEILKAMART